MKIRFRSRHGIQNIAIAQFVDKPLDDDLKFWTDGEVKDIADDRMVRFRRMVDVRSTIVTVKAVDAILDCGPDFVDESTGMNPDYVCAATGQEALDIGFLDMHGALIRYSDGDGKPLTVDEFLILHPEYIEEHLSRGMDPDRIALVREAVDKKREAAEGTATPPPEPVAAPVESTPLPDPVPGGPENPAPADDHDEHDEQGGTN